MGGKKCYDPYQDTPDGIPRLSQGSVDKKHEVALDILSNQNLSSDQPSKHGTFTQCWYNVCPSSQTLANIVPALGEFFCVCWEVLQYVDEL